jgi:hypothetical protein
VSDAGGASAREAASPASARAELTAWLDAREPAAPAALRERMDAFIDAALADADNGRAPGIATALGESGVSALRAAVAHCEERAAALDLLAADALLTYMMEAAAEQGGDAVEAVADAYGNARLAQLVANAGVA